MSYASYNTFDQYSSPSVGSSDLPIDMAEGNEANVDLIGLECDAGKDVTKEVEEVEGDCEPYKKKQRKKSSIIWQEMTLVKLENGEERVQCNHCNYKLKKQKDGTTTQYKRHLDCCIKRKINLSGQRNICVLPSTQKSESVNGVQSWKYDQARIREVISHMIMVHELPFSFVEWNATFAMLSCALDFKQVFPRYQLRDPNYNCLPSDDDWQRVEEICSLLVHFNEVTQIISVIYSEYEATRQIAIVRDSLYGLYKIYLDKYAATSKENDFQAMDTSENCVATTTWKGKGLVVETGRSKFEKFVRNVETVQNVKSELDTYLQDVRRERPARECTKRATARLQAADADAEAASKERRKKAAARKERFGIAFLLHVAQLQP
nr:zinc finger BED domain-containing protein RICESLEEPER 2-like [Ipomoea batatas]